jgi:hypothetical protein
MTLDTARRLARALGCSIDYLAGTWDSEAEAASGPTHQAVQPRRPRRRPRAKETNASATVAETT